MKEGIPRISALVITYKQEALIGRTLDSLLKQKEYLYEICVSDDCSPDNTWKVLMEYQSQYPELIKLHRNESNVGIFENVEQVWTMPVGDVIYQVSGDDEIGDGWLEKVVNYIEDNSIDYRRELFCIYGNYKCAYPNGDYYVFHNKSIERYPNHSLRLALRGLIGNRSACFSVNVMRKFDRVSQGRSHVVEMTQDALLQLYSEKNYYINGIGNIYYANIGVSAHLDDETIKNREGIIPFAEEFIESKGLEIKKRDKYYGKHQTALIMFGFYHGVLDFLKAIWYFIISFDVRFSFRGDKLRRYVFAFLRRIPHKRPIRFN